MDGSFPMLIRGGARVRKGVLKTTMQNLLSNKVNNSLQSKKKCDGNVKKW